MVGTQVAEGNQGTKPARQLRRGAFKAALQRIEGIEAVPAVAPNCFEHAPRAHLMFKVELPGEDLIEVRFERMEFLNEVADPSPKREVVGVKVGAVVRGASAAQNRFGQLANVDPGGFLELFQHADDSLVVAVPDSSSIVVVELNMLLNQRV